MADEQPQKRPRGNPQFQLNKKRKEEQQKQQTPNTMAEEKEKDPKDTPETTKAEETTKSSEPVADVKPTDTLPADLFSDKIPGSEVLPLDGEVKVKDYAALPDAGATAPPAADGSTPAPGTSAVPTAEATGAAPVAPLTPAEQEQQAKQSVTLALKGYEKLHALGRWIGKVDQTDLAGLHAKGDINLNQELPLGKKTITVGEFFEDYNKGIDENIVVTQEFKDEVTPALTRVIIKNKLFLSDELFLAMVVSEDLVTKISMIAGLRKSANMVLSAVKEMSKAQKEGAIDAKKKDSEEPITPHTEEPLAEDTTWREPGV